MSVRKSVTSTHQTGNSRVWVLLRGAGILLVLALLSFALGFFILARVLPSGRMDESGAGSSNGGRTENSNPGRSVPPPSPSTSSANASPAPRTNQPGPTIDPEDQPTVQQPDSLDSQPSHSPPVTNDHENPKPEENHTDTQKPGTTERSPFSAVTPDPAVTPPSNNERPRRRDREAVQNPTTPDNSHVSESKPSETNTAPSAGLFRVQVGVYSTREAAEQESRRLSEMGISTSVQPTTSAGRTLYRVQHGAFRNRANAEAAREKLKTAGVESIIPQSE